MDRPYVALLYITAEDGPASSGAALDGLLADHQNCKRTWYHRALGPAAPSAFVRRRRRCRRRRPTLLAHREDVVRLAVERDCSGAIHRVEILLHLETRRALLLHDGQRAVAM